MEKIALLPGGFKPPHAGHYNMAKWLASNTDANTVLIKVGAKERNGITREMSLKLWDLYRSNDSDPVAKKLQILPSTSNSPVQDVYDFIEQDAPEGSIIYLGVGEKDFEDKRFANISKFSDPKGIKFYITEVPPQSGGVSGTDMRDFISSGRKEKFNEFIPDHLTPEQKEQAWNIVIGNTNSLKDSFSKEWWSNKISEIVSDNQATINNQLIPLEIMVTPGEQAQGMMGRDSLDGGMLFPYREAEPRSFHMKNCLIPLDIVFITQGEITNIHPNCPPCSEDNCPQYTGTADNVLELEGGYCEKNNINVGDHIKFPTNSSYEVGYHDYAKSNDPGPKTPVEPNYKYNRKNFPFSSMYENKLKNLNETRGGESELHIYDFDDTIAQIETDIYVTLPNGEERTIPSPVFPEESEKLEKEFGKDIEYDFSGFNKQIENAIINEPVYNNLINSLKNPNVKTTILTARTVGHPVTKFLKSLNLPVEPYVEALGIRKQGNRVTGEDKARWIEKHLKKTVKKVYFIDDAPENRKAVYALRDNYPHIEFNVETPPKIELNELENHEIKFFAMHADILKQLNTPNFKLKFIELQQELEGDRLAALEYFWDEYFSNLEDSCEIEGSFDKKINENTRTKKWWKEIINEILLTEGGAAGHMAHPFDLPNVKSGEDLKDVFVKSAVSLKTSPGSVKIDGVNSSIRLVDLDGQKQFVMDRGSKKPLDLKGITKADLEDRFKPGHGMVKVGGEVLDMFNEALPYIQNDLMTLDVWEDPNILFNMEYVSGKTNVQDYGSNFIAIHGLNKMETKEVQGKRQMLTKRFSTEFNYDKTALQSLLNNLAPIAKKRGFEVYGSVPTEMAKEPNFSSALSKTYTVTTNEGDKNQTLDRWLGEIDLIPKDSFIFINVNGSRKKVGAVSKQVYQSILNGDNVDDLVEDENDVKKAIDGFVTYLATEKLGDEVLKVLDSPMGSVEDHEGVVIRDKKIYSEPFKITGKFILGGIASDF